MSIPIPDSTNDDLTIDVKKIPYQELLKTNEWKKFKEKIEKRDDHKCQHCEIERKTLEIEIDLETQKNQRVSHTYLQKFLDEKSGTVKEILRRNNLEFSSPPKIAFPEAYIRYFHLEVHHHYYIDNKLPWDYNETAVITLCRICHQAVHDAHGIIVYRNEDRSETADVSTCERCSGSGYLPHYHYYRDGVCFNCNGWGFIYNNR